MRRQAWMTPRYNSPPTTVLIQRPSKCKICRKKLLRITMNPYIRNTHRTFRQQNTMHNTHLTIWWKLNGIHKWHGLNSWSNANEPKRCDNVNWKTISIIIWHIHRQRHNTATVCSMNGIFSPILTEAFSANCGCNEWAELFTKEADFHGRNVNNMEICALACAKKKERKCHVNNRWVL